MVRAATVPAKTAGSGRDRRLGWKNGADPPPWRTGENPDLHAASALRKRRRRIAGRKPQGGFYRPRPSGGHRLHTVSMGTAAADGPQHADLADAGPELGQRRADRHG